VRECSHWGLEEKHAEQPRWHRLDLVRRDHRDEEEEKWRLLNEGVSEMMKRAVWCLAKPTKRRRSGKRGQKEAL